MLKLRLALRSITSLVGLIITVIRFKFTGIQTRVFYAHRVFFAFGGLPGSLSSRFLGKRKNSKLAKSPFSISSGTSAMSVMQCLKNDGFFVEERFLDRLSTKAIEEFSLKTLGSYRLTDQGDGGQTDLYYDRNNPLAVRYDYSPTTALLCPQIQRTLADQRILAIAQNYLQSEPIFDFVAMWWHAKSKNPDKNAAQYFHFDMDRLRWIKFFFYVTDVGSENGPHVFIPKSHSDQGIPFTLRKRGYTRLPDADVERYFPRNGWKSFSGSAGTMIAEDTRGLHKGAHVEKGDRLLFQFQFTSSLYGKSEERDDMEIKNESLTEELKSAMKIFPYVYQKIAVS